MKYCEQTTVNHPLSKQYPAQVETIGSIFGKEGLKSNPFGREKAINLDSIEVERCKGKTSLSSTMDLAIGVGRDGKSNRMLLVELKLRVTNPVNVTKKDIENKVRHSEDLLSYNPPIHPEKIIVFCKSRLAEARAHIARLYGKTPRLSVVVKSPEEFKKDFFD